MPRTGFERNNEAELFTTFGTFHQTNDQVNFGSHTEKFAYFGSVNGNRSDYGLETPGPDVLHDRVWGLGGMGDAHLQSRRQQPVPFRDLAAARRLSDSQRSGRARRRASATSNASAMRWRSFSWVHTFRPGLLLTVSPFYHYNRANYDGDPNDTPISTTQHRGSQYAGAQIVFSAVTRAAQREHRPLRLRPARRRVRQPDRQRRFGPLARPATEHIRASGSGISGGSIQSAGSWLTLTAGVRLTHFSGAISENAASPRLGGAIRIPHLNWVLRGFWGKYYQAPPLSTVSGPLLDFAVSQGLGFIPLRGERDQEHQFGLTIPLRGWAFDVNNYHQRARNYFDHNAIGNSNVFFPLTIDGARLYGWEVTVRSPQIAHRGEVYLSYAYAHAQGAGAVSGGLTDFSPPDSGYFLLDHDQTHTLHAGFNFSLPWRTTAGGNLYYGSGFTDGSSDVAGAFAGAHDLRSLARQSDRGESYASR